MVRTLSFALAILCATAVVIAAQVPTQVPAGDPPTATQPSSPPPSAQQPPQRPTAEPNQASATNKVTYTGCLKPGATAESWTLENAEMASTATAQARPGENPVSTSGAAATKRTFNLSPKAGDDIKPHANHKIEVIGTLNPASTSGAASGAAPGQTPSGAGARQTFNVESFKMVSATCP